jgi:hypothetical protein
MMNREVILSLLALDSYNRGYGQTIFGLPASESIGRADIDRDSLVLGSTSAGRVDEAAGFYAIAYDWNGETVISYRGTNFPSTWTLSQIAELSNDVLGGWSMFSGIGSNTHASFARQFYEDATNRVFKGESGLRAPEHVTVTGHSLGGGLAGYVGSRAAVNAVVFDPIPFGVIASADAISNAIEDTFQFFSLTEIDLVPILLSGATATTPISGSGVSLQAFFDKFSFYLSLHAPEFDKVSGHYLVGEIAQQITGLQIDIGASLASIPSVLTPVGLQQLIQGLLRAFSAHSGSYPHDLK